MVDYAMDIGEAGSEYERPVQAPTLTSAGIAAGFLEGVGNIIDSYGSSVAEGRPTEASIKREGYASFIKELDSIKGKRPLDQQVELRGIITRYEAQGFPLGEAELRAIQTRTGIDASNYMASADPNVAMATAALNELSQNPEYSLLARKGLIQEGVTNPTDMQVLERATNIIATDKAAVLHVSSSANISKSNFQTTKGLWHKALDSIKQTGLESLAILQADGNLSPEAVLGFKNRLVAIKSVMTKPQAVSSDQWQDIEAKITGLETLIDQIAGYDQIKLDAISTDALAATAERLLQQGDPLLARALINEGVMSEHIAKNAPDLLKAMGDLKPEDIEYTDISFAEYDQLAEEFAGIPNMTEVAEVQRRIAEAKTHNEEVLKRSQGYSKEERLAALNTFSGIEVAGMSIEGLQSSQDVRDIFANGVGGATAAIFTGNEPMKISTLSKLFNLNTYKKLRALELVDPTIAKGLEVKMRQALFKQATIWGRLAESELKGTPLFIEGTTGKVVFDRDSFWSQTLKSIRDPFQQGTADTIKNLHVTYYNGDFEEMIRDEGQKIKENDPRLYSLILEKTGGGNIFTKGKKQLSETFGFSNQMDWLKKETLKLKASGIEIAAMIRRPAVEEALVQVEDEIIAEATAPESDEAEIKAEDEAIAEATTPSEVKDVETETTKAPANERSPTEQPFVGPFRDLPYTAYDPYVIEEGSELEQKRQYDLLPTGSYFIDINDSVDEETGKRVVYIK